MKAAIHPQYFDQANVICVCGNRFTLGSTRDVIHVELCNKCHPFYTGEQKFVDTASRIQKFENKLKTAQTLKATVKKKQDDKKKSQDAPKSLREMLMALK
ncbi:MAG TPA: 50S ribosomal protein L31 [Patescibacteria group bacterium]|nr:50S ribosomal protein L31 [Patescibacteria group bacterium]